VPDSTSGSSSAYDSTAAAAALLVTPAASAAAAAPADSLVEETRFVLWSGDSATSREPYCIFGSTSTAAASEAFTPPVQSDNSGSAATGFSFGSAVTAPVWSARPATAAAAAVAATGGVMPTPAVATDAACSEYGGSDAAIDQAEEEEHAADHAAVKDVFSMLNPDQPDTISGSQLPALCEALGLTYSEEVCTRTLAALPDAEGNVTLQRFSDWYIHCLFTGDDDSSSSDRDSDEDSAVTAANTVKAAATTRRGFRAPAAAVCTSAITSSGFSFAANIEQCSSSSSQSAQPAVVVVAPATTVPTAKEQCLQL
jgi:hypothetical protein